MEWIVHVFWILLFIFPFSECKICLKNEIIGNREGNLYTCNDPAKQRCCVEDKVFTCCQPVSDTVLMDQLQLWGTIALMLLVMALIYVYYTKDRELFKRETLQLAIDNFVSKFKNGSSKVDKFSHLEESSSSSDLHLHSDDVKHIPDDVKHIPDDFNYANRRLSNSIKA